VTGSGSDDVLDCAFRAFGARGNVVAIPSPSFSAIPSVATVNDLRPVAVPLASDGDVDVERTLAVDARIIYLCSPNNPTGALLSRDRVATLVENTRGVVIIDEAYAEFTGSTLTDFARGYENVFVTRTFSKAFGLAGLRLGYGLGAAGLVAGVEKARGPYKVSVTAERIAVAVLREDLEWVRGRVDDVVANREAFALALERIGAPAMPSRANFVLVPVLEAQRVAERMRTRGVAVRAFSNLSTSVAALVATNGNALRVTIGSQDVMAHVLDALQEALSACA
jgi:histidinol-phosphate aminotransferase